MTITEQIYYGDLSDTVADIELELLRRMRSVVNPCPDIEVDFGEPRELPADGLCVEVTMTLGEIKLICPHEPVRGAENMAATLAVDLAERLELLAKGLRKPC